MLIIIVSETIGNRNVGKISDPAVQLLRDNSLHRYFFCIVGIKKFEHLPCSFVFLTADGDISL